MKQWMPFCVLTCHWGIAYWNCTSIENISGLKFFISNDGSSIAPSNEEEKMTGRIYKGDLSTQSFPRWLNSLDYLCKYGPACTLDGSKKWPEESEGRRKRWAAQVALAQTQTHTFTITITTARKHSVHFHIALRACLTNFALAANFADSCTNKATCIKEAKSFLWSSPNATLGRRKPRRSALVMKCKWWLFLVKKKLEERRKGGWRGGVGLRRLWTYS